MPLMSGGRHSTQTPSFLKGPRPRKITGSPASVVLRLPRLPLLLATTKRKWDVLYNEHTLPRLPTSDPSRVASTNRARHPETGRSLVGGWAVLMWTARRPVASWVDGCLHLSLREGHVGMDVSCRSEGMAFVDGAGGNPPHRCLGCVMRSIVGHLIMR